MDADRERAGDFAGGQHGADREAAAQPLGAGEDVRHDALLHVREERAGAAHPALDLVQDQQRAVRGAQPARSLQVLRRARPHAAFALHRLQDHRADVRAVGRELGFERRDVVVGQVDEAGGIGTEAAGVLLLPAGGDGEQRAPVEGVLRRDDPQLVRAEPVVRVAARELQRRLVRLGTGIAEEHALGERGVGQPLGEPQRRFVGEPVRHVPQPARLLVDRLDHRRMAVAQRGDRDAAAEVDVHPPVLVPDARTLAAHRDEGRRGEAGHHDLVEQRPRDRHLRGIAGRGQVAPRGGGEDRLSGGGEGGHGGPEGAGERGAIRPRRRRPRPGSRPCTRARRDGPGRWRAPASRRRRPRSPTPR